MKIAVMGAGGQGGLFGGLLHKAGEDVVLIDRGPHLEAIKQHGLTLKSAGPRELIADIAATGNPGDVGPVGLLLFCVKTYDLESAAGASRPMVGRNTTVLPTQNGVMAPDRLSQIYGGNRVIGGVSYHQGIIESPGVISYGGVSGKLYLGELDGGSSSRVEEVHRVLCGAGIDSEIHPTIRTAMWEKLVLICATGGVMAYHRRTAGPILADREGRALMLGVMEEAEAVARADGIDLPDDVAGGQLEFIETAIAPDARSSQLDDVLAGKKLELEYLNGEIVRLGRKLGIPTPHNKRVYDALKPLENGAIEE